MSNITNYDLGTRGIKALMVAMETYTATSWLGKIAMSTNSDQLTESYSFLGFSPTLSEWTGKRKPQNLKDEGFTITNKVRDAAIEFLTDDLRRCKNPELIDARIADLAQRAVMNNAYLVSELIANGATSGYTCYDGQEFFDTTHSSGSSGTLQNDIDATDCTLLNVTGATGATLLPTTAELQVAIMQVIAYMSGYLDDQGQPYHMNPKEWIVMTNNHFAAQFATAINSLSLSLATNTVLQPNILQSNFNVSYVMNPWLNSHTALNEMFFVFRADSLIKPFIIQTEEAVKTVILGPGSEYEKQYRKCMFAVEETGNAGYGLWQNACRATLS